MVAEKVDETVVARKESFTFNSQAPSSIQKKMVVNKTRPSPECAVSGTRPSENCTSQPEPSHLNCIDAPDTWEEFADSDASTDIPEDVQEMDQLGAPPVLGDDNRPCEKNQSCPPQDSRQQRCEATDASFDLAGLKDSQPREGSHSRFRKDLVNLNKAIAKWIRQERSGEISYSKVIERIGDSRVAQHLSKLHGCEFDKDRFIQDALKRAAREKTEHL
jgi:hypothetical protein